MYIYCRRYCSVAVHEPLCCHHCAQFVFTRTMCRYDVVYILFTVR